MGPIRTNGAKMDEARPMVSAGCIFRGNYMLRDRAENFVRSSFCSVPKMLPDSWDFVEPIGRQFVVADVGEALARKPGLKDIASHVHVFFLRKSFPTFCASIMLNNNAAPRSHHNCVNVDLGAPWPGGEGDLAHLIPNILAPEFPDYGYVADAPMRDRVRFAELFRPLTAAEVLSGTSLSSPHSVALFTGRPRDGLMAWYSPDHFVMQGPHGFVQDIVWFNYFGRPYVDLIGRKRLMAAGWARVEEVGDGLACYATERIDDPDSFDRRARIRDALFEFVWTPGCKREDKTAPVFDFSEQIAAAPQTSAPILPPGARLVEFAGFDTEGERQQAIKAFEEQTGMVYDANTRMMLPRRG